MKLMSPDSSAATRVGADAMGVNSMRSRLWRGLSHQSLFTTSTVRVSGRYDSTLKGPVPLAWCVA
ncbi:hypothetical protein D3C77_807010 [compost metagenome]